MALRSALSGPMVLQFTGKAKRSHKPSSSGCFAPSGLRHRSQIGRLTSLSVRSPFPGDHGAAINLVYLFEERSPLIYTHLRKLSDGLKNWSLTHRDKHRLQGGSSLSMLLNRCLPADRSLNPEQRRQSCALLATVALVTAFSAMLRSSNDRPPSAPTTGRLLDRRH